MHAAIRCATGPSCLNSSSEAAAAADAAMAAAAEDAAMSSAAGCGRSALLGTNTNLTSVSADAPSRSCQRAEAHAAAFLFMCGALRHRRVGRGAVVTELLLSTLVQAAPCRREETWHFVLSHTRRPAHPRAPHTLICHPPARLDREIAPRSLLRPQYRVRLPLWSGGAVMLRVGNIPYAV